MTKEVLALRPLITQVTIRSPSPHTPALLPRAPLCAEQATAFVRSQHIASAINTTLQTHNLDSDLLGG